MEKYSKLEELFSKSKEFFETEKLDIFKHATKHVTDLGSGNPNADIVFVGEAPGATEDYKGQPFIGIAGRILREGLLQTDISMSECWFTNVVKWRPMNEQYKNRPPTPHEISVCYPLLEKEIKIINPKVIVTLGLSALDTLTDYKFSKLSIFSLIGNISYDWHGYPLFIMFHPMVVKYQPKKAHIFYENLTMLKGFVRSLRRSDDNKSELEKLLNL